MVTRMDYRGKADRISFFEGSYPKYTDNELDKIISKIITEKGLKSSLAELRGRLLEDDIHFENVHFERNVHFEGFSFPDHCVSFKGSQFDKSAKFQYVKFFGGVSFENTIFGNGLNLANVQAETGNIGIIQSTIMGRLDLHILRLEEGSCVIKSLIAHDKVALSNIECVDFQFDNCEFKGAEGHRNLSVQNVSTSALWKISQCQNIDEIQIEAPRTQNRAAYHEGDIVLSHIKCNNITFSKVSAQSGRQLIKDVTANNLSIAGDYKRPHFTFLDVNIRNELSIRESGTYDFLSEKNHSIGNRVANLSLISDGKDRDILHELILKGSGYEVGKFSVEGTFQASWIFDESFKITGDTIIRGCHFNNKSNIEFKKTYFGGKVNFRNTKFDSSLRFDGVTFANYAPDFRGASLHQATEWSGNILWPTPTPDNAEQLAYCYERLKQEMESLKKHDAEQDFFRKELRAKRELLSKTSAKYWLNKCYETFGEYGYGVHTPFAWWVACSSLFFATYSAALSGSVQNAFYFSLTNALPLIPMSKLAANTLEATLSHHQWLILPAVLQGLFSIILLFLIGLGLRNRFRIK